MSITIAEDDTSPDGIVPTDLIDLRDLPLSRVGAFADAGLLKRVLPEQSAKRVPVAAFQSSI